MKACCSSVATQGRTAVIDHAATTNERKGVQKKKKIDVSRTTWTTQRSDLHDTVFESGGGGGGGGGRAVARDNI